MAYNIRMGIPEMEELWNKLQTSYRDGTISKKDAELYKKWGDAVKKLAMDPHYPSLNSHEIEPLSRRYGMKVWESYLENNTSGARRMFWVYGPNQMEITIIGLEPHPEDAKKGAYDRVNLSDLN
jgi:ABC-type phosphate transport system substrate-binding protein